MAYFAFAFIVIAKKCVLIFCQFHQFLFFYLCYLAPLFLFDFQWIIVNHYLVLMVGNVSVVMKVLDVNVYQLLLDNIVNKVSQSIPLFWWSSSVFQILKWSICYTDINNTANGIIFVYNKLESTLYSNNIFKLQYP